MPTTAPTPIPPTYADLRAAHERCQAAYADLERARADRDAAARFLADDVTKHPDESADPYLVAAYVRHRDAVPVAGARAQAAYEVSRTLRVAWDLTQGRREVGA